MSMIEVSDLRKSFRVKQKEKGFTGSLRSIVSPRYRDIQAVDGISFQVGRGEMLAFIGPNGAGKSTTIKMLTGILYRDGGDIRVLGMDPSVRRKALAYRIGTVFGQKEQLWMHLTPHDNFKFFAAIYDIPDADAEKKIESLNQIFELQDFNNAPVKSLSLGQRIRCEIAASLIHTPEILFLDEPTIGLDPVVKESIRSLIKTMNAELRTTVFLTSHDIGDIEKLCKRVIIINNGKTVLDSGIDRLKYNYLDKKIVEVKMSEVVDLSNRDGITVLKDKGYALKLEIDTKKKNIVDVIKLLDADKIIDINISNIPLEEVIGGIYQAGEPV